MTETFEPIASIAARVLTDMSGRVRRQDSEGERPHGCNIGAGGIQCGGVPTKFSGDDLKGIFRLMQRDGPSEPTHAARRKNDQIITVIAFDDLPVAAG